MWLITGIKALTSVEKNAQEMIGMKMLLQFVTAAWAFPKVGQYGMPQSLVWWAKGACRGLDKLLW